MRERRGAIERRRAREFESFVGGAGARLLHVAALLTGESAGAATRAERLLISALAATYADWRRLPADDPYDHARRQIALRYARGAWLRRSGTGGGVLGPLRPLERVVLVLRLYEGVDEVQTASLTGLPVERVYAVCARAVSALTRPAVNGHGAEGKTGAAS